jgi:intracellular multiplication protein IcmD
MYYNQHYLFKLEISMSNKKVFCKCLKIFSFLAVVIACLYVGSAFASAPAPTPTPGTATGISGIAGNITGAFQGLGQLMIAISYLAGIGFTIASIFKFKQHKDNPTQIPMGTPIALLGVGIILIFLPAIVGPIGETIFGTGKTDTAGGYLGTGGQLPGANK